MEERKSKKYISSDEEDEETEEEESDSSNSDDSSSSSCSDAKPNYQQSCSSSEASSVDEEQLCPAARLLVCNRRHQVHSSARKKSSSRKKSPVRKSSSESKSSKTRRKNSTVTNTATQTFQEEDDSDNERDIVSKNQRNHHQGLDSSTQRKKSKSKKSKDRKHSVEKSTNHHSRSSQERLTRAHEHSETQTEREAELCTSSEDHVRRKSSMAGRMSSSFMQEKPIKEEDEEEDNRTLEDDERPIRGMSNLKVREDTLDGAEAPDHDPPQRRRTLEDISITELSALRAELPPEYPEDTSPPTLLPCVSCSRTFNPAALDRHRKVCQKMAKTNKKKQIFNAHTQKFEPEDPLSPSSGRATTPERGLPGAAPTPTNKKSSRWREKHQEFLRTIRAARGAPEGDADAGAPTSLVPSDYVQCPVCGRHFGPKAADRHIQWCKEQSSRLPSNAADTQLVERLKTRTKYVPPKPGQSGWRAPKKTDVISSIPPPSTSDRKISPPPLIPSRRGVTTSPSLQRRGTSPAPLSRQHSTASLGRSAARSFSSILQAVGGSYSSPYGQRHSVGGSQSGYATPSCYSAYGVTGSQTPSLTRSGSFSGSAAGQPFVRSASLRVASSRRASGERKARRRDLASDMLASVCLSSSPARGEPEGDEADDFTSRETTLSPPPFSKSHLDSSFDLDFDVHKYDAIKYDSAKYDTTKYDSSKYDSTKYQSSKYDSGKKDLGLDFYDPYSAAEMQMQALLGPTFGGGTCKDDNDRGSGLGAAGMGIGNLGTFSTNSRKLSDTLLNSEERPSKLKIITPTSPAPLRFHRQTLSSSPETSDILSPTPFGAGDSSNDKRFWRRSPSPPISRDRWSPSPKSPAHTWTPTRRSPNREDRLSITSFTGGSRDSSRSGTAVGKETLTKKNELRDDRLSSAPLRGTLSLPSNPKKYEHLAAGSSISEASPSWREGGNDSSSIEDSSRTSTGLSASSRFASSASGDSGSTRFGFSSAGGSRFGSTSIGTTARASASSSLISPTGLRTEGNGAAESRDDHKFSNEETSASSFKALRLALSGDRRDQRPEASSFTIRKSSGSSSDSSLPPLSSPMSPTTPAKSVRGDTVGGHGPLVTPRLGPAITEPVEARGSTFSREHSPSETLQDVISSLTAIGNSPTSNRLDVNSGGYKSTFSEPKASKLSSLSDAKSLNVGNSKNLFNASNSSKASIDNARNLADSAKGDDGAPRFCYECGHKYPLTLAKFCCHCGSRRAPASALH